MWKTIKFSLAVAAPIIAVVIGVLNYQLSQKGYELQTKKFKEGEIPKKNLQIVTYGGLDAMSSLKSFTDSSFNINIAGKKLKNLYQISYYIENNGEAPIMQNDFLEKLTVVFPKRWQILGLKSSYSDPPDFHPVWEIIDNNKIQLKPILINAKDKFYLNIYLSDKEDEKFERNEFQDLLQGTWTVRIPNLSKIDIQDPVTRKLKQKPTNPIIKARYGDYIDVLVRTNLISSTTAPLFIAGFLIDPGQWGVYAILVLAAVMIFVYLNLLYPLRVHFNFNKQLSIFCIVMVSVFCFAASECYITFFAQLGKDVAWINYIFMFLYLVSIIILFLVNKKIKAS
jgi:hypothetical protein